MHYSLALILLLTLSGLNVGYSQGVIRGKVTDNNSGDLLPGVYVIYEKNKGTTTDPDGRFIIKADTGKHNITFQFIGY
jgi:hypothetical protein